MAFTELPPSEWVATSEQVAAMGQYLYNSGPERGLALDTETEGTDIVTDSAILFSLSDGLRRFAGYVEPWIHEPWVEQALLLNPAIIKRLTNAKFDRHMLENKGVRMVGPFHCTLVMDWLYNENRQGRHGLKETAHDYCGLQMVEFKDIFHPMPAYKGCKPSKKNPNGIPPRIKETAGEAIRRTMSTPEGWALATHYAGLDAFSSWHVADYLEQQLKQIFMFPGRSLWDHFLEYEVPFNEVLYNMERRGFMIHQSHLYAQLGPILRDTAQLEQQFKAWTNLDLNVGSPDQMRDFFFNTMGMKPIKWTDGGKSGVKKPSLDEEVLKVWIGTHDVNCWQYADLVLKHRQLEKIKGTYIEGLIESAQKDPRMRSHSFLKHEGTVTGRISSTEPNLMNIPRPKTDKYKIRNAFIAPPGRMLVVCDYDQLEMKLMAHFSGDEKMIGAINAGQDLHCFTVSLMFGVAYDEVMAAKKADKYKDVTPLTPRQEELLLMRQQAKSVGFGLIYGIGPEHLGHQLTEETGKLVTKENAKELIQRYFAVFEGVKRFMDETKKYCRRTEYVQTFLGRFRRLPEINARGSARAGDDLDNQGVAAQAGRQSINTIIQGTAADVAKVAMLRVEWDAELKACDAIMLLQIHDELIMECPNDHEIIKRVEKRLADLMMRPWGENPFRVPLTCEAHHGLCWTEAK